MARSLALAAIIASSTLFSPSFSFQVSPSFVTSRVETSSIWSHRQNHGLKMSSSPSEDNDLTAATEKKDWDGEVASNTGGKMRGCSVEKVPTSLTVFTVNVDGVEADLGKFSQAIYVKILNDAKRERFQGFRPGTVPPHLLQTYKSFSMDECAREATLEAMEQNNIRAFEDSRTHFEFENVSILPPVKKKKKKGGRKGKKKAPEEEGPVEEVWLSFDTMKEALDAGWEPGQSFSFTARDCRGQDALLGGSSSGSSLGARAGAGMDLNQIAANVAATEAKQ